MKNIVILGGGYAGMMAAIRLSHTAKRMKDVQVTLVNAVPHFVERIRLHEVAANHPPKANKIESLLKGTGVKFLQAWVTQIDAEKKVVQAEANGETIRLSYDKLVYALGSRVNRDAVEGAREYAYTLDPDSAQKLQTRLKNLRDGARVVVIGGGLTGIEAATEFAETYPKLKVSLITNGKLGQNLSQLGQEYLHKAFGELGIEILEHTNVKAIEASQMLLGNGATILADAVLWAAGFVAPSLAKEAGLKVNNYGRILVDSSLRSQSHPDIFAAGDVMDFDHNSPIPVRMSCQVAMPLGIHVGDNLAAWLKGKDLVPFEFGYVVQCIGLGQKRGLLQFIKPDDSMVEKVVTGWQGSLAKKGILTFTLAGLKLERMIPFSYQYAKNIQQAEQAQKMVLEG